MEHRRTSFDSEDQRPDASSRESSENEEKDTGCSSTMANTDFSGRQHSLNNSQDEDQDEQEDERPWVTKVKSCPLFRDSDILQVPLYAEDEMEETPEVPELRDLIGSGTITVKNTFLEFAPQSTVFRRVKTAAGRLELMSNED